MKDQVLFPKIEVREKGFLKVSDIHTIYWERSGNPKGKKILVIHGGPGGGSQPRYRRYFDPDKFDIIQFDQRGCGSSCLLYTSPSPRDDISSRMPSSA